MLAGHPDVCAPGETWLMLPLVHAISGGRRNVSAPYDSILGDDALSEFVQRHLPRGWSDVQNEMGQAARRIYARARNAAGAAVLLDKTPRYYWIVEDLLALLPECRMIVLLRNPLAVLASIVRTWTNPRRVGFLKDYRADLLEAPTRLAGAVEIQDSRILSLRYEDLVADPERELETIQRFLGLPVQSGLSHYESAQDRLYGDPVGIHRSSSARSNSSERYLEDASSSATLWRLLDDYRDALGPKLLARLGYDDEELARKLASVRPKRTGMAPPLRSQVAERPAEPLRSLIRLRRMTAEGFTSRRAA